MAAGGQYAGSPSYSYTTGPDGQRYASGGSVPIDSSPVSGDPQATIQKMRQVRAAALAPANPSGADRQIAAQAARELTTAQSETRTQETDDEAEADSASATESSPTTAPPPPRLDVLA